MNFKSPEGIEPRRIQLALYRKPTDPAKRSDRDGEYATLSAQADTPRRAPPCKRVIWSDYKGEPKYTKGVAPKRTPKKIGKKKIATVGAVGAAGGAVIGCALFGVVGLAVGGALTGFSAAGATTARKQIEKRQQNRVKKLIGWVPPTQNPPSRSFPVAD